MAVAHHPGVASVENPPLSSERLFEERSNMYAAFVGMTDHPPGKSPEIRAFAETGTEQLKNPEQYPEFNALADSLNQARQDMPAEQRAHLLRIGIQFALMRHAKDYPKNGRDPGQWHSWLDQVLSNPKIFSDVEDALWSYNNQANIPKRYAGLRLAIAACADVLPESVSWVDAGTSAGLGMPPIEKNMDFKNVWAYQETPRRERTLFYGALRHPVDITDSIGFDLLPQNKFWVEASSYYPHELTDIRLREEREKIYGAVDRRRVILGDLANPDSGLDGVRAKLPDGRADVASAMTCVYEIPLNEQEVALKALEGLANYLVVVQDVAEPDPNDPSKLIFPEDDIYAKKADYNLLVKVLSRPDAPYIKLGRWLTFRCSTFKPEPALIEMLERTTA